MRLRCAVGAFCLGCSLLSFVVDGPAQHACMHVAVGRRIDRTSTDTVDSIDLNENDVRWPDSIGLERPLQDVRNVLLFLLEMMDEHYYIWFFLGSVGTG
jgi:hypothetical protein